MSADYSFPGVQPFIERSAAEAGVPALAITPLRGLWHVARVQDALAQVAKADPATRESLLDQAIAHRDALVAALDGVDAAIDHVRKGIAPKPDPEPAEPEPSDESPADEEADLEPEAHDADGND
ncbi:hypothetical protein [Paludisphaera rhizosphaerae]|uniref:hypothetical protein n=1 Tax=Paludisphaera rhizosphaerae TaxID=2711216 RepID=UPI0013EC449D|nr:hypothetical protein [Paludisphaera rhizosphaerae]